MSVKKDFVILFDREKREIVFPVRAPLNLYDPELIPFAGGFPTLFGGLRSEWDHSRSLVELVEAQSVGRVSAAAPFTMFSRTRLISSDCYFYWTDDFSWADDHGHEASPLPKHRRSFTQGEMASLASVPIEDLATSTATQVRGELIMRSLAPGGTGRQRSQFEDSETLRAFTHFICKVAPVL